MGQSVMQRTFAAGELAPVLHSRADQVKYQTGLKTCRNWIIRREGGATNRAGYRFVEPCKTDSAGTRFMPYVDSVPGQAYLIEVGAAYFRFVRRGAYIEVSGVQVYDGATAYMPGDLASLASVNYYCHTATTGHQPPNASYWHALTGKIYEIPTPYDLDHLPNWNQSGNVITLTHDEKAPMELVFSSASRWVLRAVSTLPTIAPPTSVVGTPGAVGTRTVKYVVSAAATTSYEESGPSGAATIANCAEPTVTAPNTLAWDAQATAAEFYVYSDGGYGNGVYGYIGTAATNAFKDGGVIPDFNMGPPVPQSLFDDTGKYPAHSSNHGQRRYFAGTVVDPDGLFGSKIGFPSNFAISSPLQDDDAVTFRLAGNNYQAIRHLRSLKAGLVLLTDGGEWTMTGGGGKGNPITPSSVDAEQETYTGVKHDVRPVAIGNTLIYVQARGSVVRELKFEQAVEGLAGRDLSIWSSHLFERHTVVAMDFQQVPHSVVWCVRDDGVLLGMTYIPEQEVWGWHRHDTDGAIEDVCVIPEIDEDAVYVLVARTIGGQTKRYIERLARREIRDDYTHADSFFVDCGLSYEESMAKTVFLGLGHLEGRLVSVLADGQVVFDANTPNPTAAQIVRFTVTAGRITLQVAARNVHIGLPYVSDLETLDLDVEGSAIRAKKKHVASVDMLLERSSRTVQCGPDASHLRPFVPEKWQGTAPLYSGEIELSVTADWNKGGRVFVRQSAPLPATVIGIIPNVDLGG